MKRVQSACICQTLHFQLNEDLGHSYAVQKVNEEIEVYKNQLEKKRTQYKILEEARQRDESVIIKIVKQYNSTTPVGNYLENC